MDVRDWRKKPKVSAKYDKAALDLGSRSLEYVPCLGTMRRQADSPDSHALNLPAGNDLSHVRGAEMSKVRLFESCAISAAI